MIKSSVLLAKFTQGLLQQPKDTVIMIGRENIKRDSYTALQIVIDDLGNHELVCKTKSFDGVSEIMRHYQRWRSDMTIDFYGDAARTEAQRFTSLLDTQNAEDMRRDLNITLYYTNAVTDVKLLSGEQYSQHLQLSVNIEYLVELDEPILRIDTLQFQLESD